MVHASAVPPTFDWQLPPGHDEAPLQAAPALLPPTHALDDAQSAFELQPWNVAFGAQYCSNGPPEHSPSFPAVHVPPGQSDATLQLRSWLLPPTQVFVGEHIPSVQSFGFVP